MKQSFLYLLTILFSVFSPLKISANEKNDVQLDQLFQDTVTAYQDIQSIEAEAKLSLEYPVNNQQIYSAYLPFKFSLSPEIGFNGHLEMIDGSSYNNEPFF